MCRRCDWLWGELTLRSVIFQSVFFSLEEPVRGGLSGLSGSSGLSGLSGFLVERNSPDEPNQPETPNKPYSASCYRRVVVNPSIGEPVMAFPSIEVIAT